MLRFVLILFLGMTVLLGADQVQARVVFSTEVSGTHEPSFYIDSGDTADDFIDLEFGSSLDARLRYDVVNDIFQINRDTDFSGNEVVDVKLENLSAAPTCNVASQGRIYYNTTSDQSYVCDGSGWNVLEGGVTNTQIRDLDNNTQIQVEEGSNDDTIRFDTDGIQRMTIDPNGNIGFKTAAGTVDTMIFNQGKGSTATAPDIQFNTSGLIAAESSLTLNIDSDDSQTTAYFRVMNNGNNISDATELLRFDEDGDLGLGGETSPDHKIDIEGTGTLIELGDGTSSDVNLNFDDGTDHLFGWSGTNNRFEVEDDFSLGNKELEEFRVENLSAAPACDAASEGRVYYDTVDKDEYYCDGSIWRGDSIIFSSTGRHYLYTDTRWTTWSHNSYGPNYYQRNQSAGTAADPVVSWAGIGHWVPKGTRITGINLAGRANNTTVTDVEIMWQFRHTNPITRWESGYDNSGEDLHFDIYRNFWWNNTTPGQPAFTGNINDIHRRYIAVDYVTPEDGWIDQVMQPTNNPGGTRYFYGSTTLEYTLPK